MTLIVEIHSVIYFVKNRGMQRKACGLDFEKNLIPPSKKYLQHVYKRISQSTDHKAVLTVVRTDCADTPDLFLAN